MYYESELYHHGIKGQKWGVRRFQNSDGSLTAKGKSRYSQGKEISKERDQIEKKEYSRLIKTDKEYLKMEKEAMRIAEKYGLDLDDGGGGDASRWSEKDLQRAGQRYWDYSENAAAREEILSEKAYKYANDKILEKYGDVGVSNMEHYSNVSSAIAVGATMTVFAGMIALSMINK